MDDKKAPPLSNQGGIGGSGRGLEDHRPDTGPGAPFGSDTPGRSAMADDDKTASGESAGSTGLTEGDPAFLDGRAESRPGPSRATPTGEGRSFSQDAEDAGDPAGASMEPDTVEINRAREQGAGVGARDIQGQRDPTRRESQDRR